MAPSQTATDKKILDYHGVILHQSDLDLLKIPCFINGRLIDFFFAHLTATSPSAINGDVVLVPPSLTICPGPEALTQNLAPLNLSNRNLIIFTVNKYGDNGFIVCSQWSLLLYDRRANRYFHFDSTGAGNTSPAMSLCSAVNPFVRADVITFAGWPTPRDRGGIDGGLHVMAAARAICRWREGGLIENLTNLVREEAEKVPQMRAELLRLITDLKFV